MSLPDDSQPPADPAAVDSPVTRITRRIQVTAGGFMATSVLTHVVAELPAIDLPAIEVGSSWTLLGGAAVFGGASAVRAVRAVWMSGFSAEFKISKRPPGTGTGKHHR